MSAAKFATAKAALFVLKPEWQARREKQVNDEHVAALCGALEDGHELPPVSVVKLEDGSLALVDGYHRFEAMCRVGRDRIPFVVVGNGAESILWQLARANAGNGLSRCAGSKRDAVQRALEAPEGADMDNVGIARWCCVSVDLVRDVRTKLRGAPSAAAERKQVIRGEREASDVSIPERTERRNRAQKVAESTEVQRPNVDNPRLAAEPEPMPFDGIEPEPAPGSWEEVAAAHREVMQALSQLKRDHHRALLLCHGSQRIIKHLDDARGVAKVNAPQACPAPHGDDVCFICSGKGFVVGDPGNWQAQLAARKRMVGGSNG